MKRTQIYLTDSENQGINYIIQRNGGGTKTDIIRRALDEYLDKYKQVSVNNICSIPPGQFISPGIPSWSKPLPNPTHVGRKVKVVKGNWAGKVGTVISHWINGDDCSGGWGYHLYQLDTHNYGVQNNSYGINVEDCEFID